MLVRYDLPDGCCASYYPETQPLIALAHVDPDSLTPAYKSVPVRVRLATQAADMTISVGRECVSGRLQRCRNPSHTVRLGLLSPWRCIWRTADPAGRTIGRLQVVGRLDL